MDLDSNTMNNGEYQSQNKDDSHVYGYMNAGISFTIHYLLTYNFWEVKRDIRYNDSLF